MRFESGWAINNFTFWQPEQGDVFMYGNTKIFGSSGLSRCEVWFLLRDVSNAGVLN